MAAGVRAGSSVSQVPDARIVRDYVASTDDQYVPQMPSPHAWSEVVDAMESYASEVIERRGAFPVTGTSGIFICKGPRTPSPMLPIEGEPTELRSVVVPETDIAVIYEHHHETGRFDLLWVGE